MSIRSDGSISSRTYVQVKSKFDAEFRRFHIDTESDKFDDLKNRVENLHHISEVDFIITYTEPHHGELLPINNNENFANAVKTCVHSILRLYVHRKDTLNVLNGFGTSTVRRKKGKKIPPTISFPEDFRPVSAIIDVDILPETLRRVRLHKHGSNKPLGFYIRDGMSLKMTTNGLEKVPGIFISRLVQGGLAEMTGLLAVDDEVLEVNHIEVTGKTLDQVTDMMVANSSNLIITVKPASMRNAPSSSRPSARAATANNIQHVEAESDDEDTDIVKEIPMISSSSGNQKPAKSPTHSRDSSTSSLKNSKERNSGRHSQLGVTL